MSPTEVQKQAREFSPGIAEWIDAQRAKGIPDVEIIDVLKAATTLARFEGRKPA